MGVDMGFGNFLRGLGSAVTPFVGPTIAAAGSLFGGHVDRRAAREAAQKSIQWRVADAQAAGVHPLFALGASPSFPSSTGASFAQAGEQIGNAVTASRDVQGRALLALQMDALRNASKKDFSESTYWEAIAAKTRQEMVNSAPAPPLNVSQFVDDESGAIVRSVDPMMWPDRVIEAPVQRAGLDNPDRAQPGWTAFEFGDGPIVLPYTPANQGLMESLEGLDVKYLPAVIAENIRRYGPAGGQRMQKLYSDYAGHLQRSDKEQQRSRKSFGYRGRGAPSR